MERYKIYCTEEQTKKALELGAPIKKYPMHMYDDDGSPKFVHNNEWNRSVFSYCPTAEQMIGWLEEQGIRIHVHAQFNNTYSWYVVSPGKISALNESANRKEATLAAIDVALDYLIKNK